MVVVVVAVGMIIHIPLLLQKTACRLLEKKVRDPIRTLKFCREWCLAKSRNRAPPMPIVWPVGV